jgi:hypothetical protein
MAHEVLIELPGWASPVRISREGALKMAAALLVAADEHAAFETVAWDTASGEALLSAGFLELLAAEQTRAGLNKGLV